MDGVLQFYNDRMDKLEEKVDKLQDVYATIAEIKTLTCVLEKNYDKMTQIMEDFRSTQKDISENLKLITQEQSRLAQEQKDMKCEMKELSGERNINIISFIKEHWFKVVFAGYAIYEIYNRLPKK